MIVVLIGGIWVTLLQSSACKTCALPVLWAMPADEPAADFEFAFRSHTRPDHAASMGLAI